MKRAWWCGEEHGVHLEVCNTKWLRGQPLESADNIDICYYFRYYYFRSRYWVRAGRVQSVSAVHKLEMMWRPGRRPSGGPVRPVRCRAPAQLKLPGKGDLSWIFRERVKGPACPPHVAVQSTHLPQGLEAATCRKASVAGTPHACIITKYHLPRAHHVQRRLLVQIRNAVPHPRTVAPH